MKTIQLINSEGPILTLGKELDENLFVLIDEYKKPILLLSKYALGLFLKGDIIVFDSQQRKWDYSKVDKGMKCKPESLTSFLLEVL